MKVRLFTANPTPAQTAIVSFWYLIMLAIFVMWATTSLSLLTSGTLAGALLAIGRLLGLLAVFFALTQFMLMGRVYWIERRFGLDHLAAYHRINGYLAISSILLHPCFVVASYALTAHVNIVHEYTQVVFHYSYAWLAVISQALFIIVVASSIYIARKHLKFESWYYVHLSVYAAITLTFFHQFALGGSLNGHPLARVFWYGLYAFVAANVLLWRFTLPTFNLLRFDFRVSRVVKETSTTTSVYIKMRHPEWWHSRAGQFVLIRIFSKELWTQEHPFSLSALPKDAELRLTIRKSGDYTALIAQLKPGKRVLLSGPFGRFTDELIVTHKRLFVAGGVGITPIRPLIEQALASQTTSTLIYGNRTPDDVVFKDELHGLQNSGLKMYEVYSDAPRGYNGERGYVTADLIARLTPDYKQRDIYLCGPPPMMESIIVDLTKKGVKAERLHFERFALHN